MKVALELQPCCGNRTGIGNYAYELAKCFQAGDDISFQGNLFNFCRRNNNQSALSGIQMPIAENEIMPYGVYRRIWNFLPISYERMFPPADITHFFNYIVPPKIKGKIITTIHDMTYLRFPETMDQKNLRRIRGGISRSIDASEIILTISEFSKQEIMDLLGLPAERIAVVYYAASLGKMSAEVSSLSKLYHIRPPYLLYIGTIEPRKNLIRLLKAYERLKREANIPHQLVLAGGRGWRCDDVYQTAAEISGHEDVVFCGYVPSNIKNALYQNADAFVFPSLYEGFGIPPLEAMTFGVPVICADAASLPEVVGNCARFVCPTDELSIAEGIYQVISDPLYAQALGKKGQKRARIFSWDHSAQQLKNIYQAMK